MALLERAVKDKDAEKSITESKNVVAVGSAFLNFAEKEVENTTDEYYKSDLQNKIGEVKKCMHNV